MNINLKFTDTEIENYLNGAGYIVENVSCKNSVTGEPTGLCSVAYQSYNGSIPYQIQNSSDYYYSDLISMYHPESVFHDLMAEKLKNLLL